MFYRIPFEGVDVSKPRGKLSKQGHIYHSSAQYTAYKTKIYKLINRHINDNQTIVYPIGIALVHAFETKPAQNDLDNLVGAIMDCFKQHGTIQDDSERYLQSLYCDAIESGVGDHGVIYVWSIRDHSAIDIVSKMQADIEGFKEANEIIGYNYKYRSR